MAAASKSSKGKNLAIALLALWSIISLIIIVVWATSPNLKSSAQCRAELQEVTEKMERAKVVYNKDKVALEEMVEAEREQQKQHKAEIQRLLTYLNATNATLEECQQENVILNGTITVLQDKVEQLRQTEANLTAQLRLQEDQIEVLQQNLTLMTFQNMTCYGQKEVAEKKMSVAETQTKTCELREQHLQKQLQKCKEVESEVPSKLQPQAATPGPGSAAAAPLAGIPVLTLLVFSALHLIT